MLSNQQKLTQTQRLTPQQIQYQKLLQLNNLALEQRIKEELELPELPSKPHKRTKNWVIEYNHDGVWKRWFGRFAKKEDAIKSALKQTTWELSMIGLGLRYTIRKNYRVRNLETDEDFYL